MLPEVVTLWPIERRRRVRALIDKGLVRVTGRADQLGRPFLYGTTGLFLERFGLKNLAQLPRPRAINAPGN